jgi:two-component system, NarL family, nitrate/nitrite response regulator NarL
MNRTAKIAIVDDHPVVRRGIAETFGEQSDFEIVGEGASADDAIALIKAKRPDLIILDVSMPGGGVEAAEQIRKLDPTAKIMMLSIREDLATVRAALKAGARGYVSKGVDGTDLVASARRILIGERYVSPALAARLIEHEHEIVAPAASPKHGTPTGANLTQREQQIFDLLRRGLSNQAIASHLGLSENTVKHYITPLMHKLGVRNRTEAAVLAKGGELDRSNE